MPVVYPRPSISQCSLVSAFVNPIPEYDATGIQDYILECNKSGVIPVSYFQRHCHDKAFVMRNHGLGPLGAKAIAKPLEVRHFRSPGWADNKRVIIDYSAMSLQLIYDVSSTVYHYSIYRKSPLVLVSVEWCVDFCQGVA